MTSDPAVPPHAPATGRSSRKLQCWLVLTVAFALPIISSLIVFFGHRTLHAATPRRMFIAVVFQLTGLACLYLVLHVQKRGLRDIGVELPMRITEIGHSFALFFGAFPIGFVVAIALLAVYGALGHDWQRSFNDAALFGNRISIWTVVFVLLNPFHEELIVRGFLITEMEYFYNNTALAVFVSVLVQSSYHLYQGLAPAILHASTFLLFSIYFVRTRRILPVVIAHMFLDVSALSLYARHLAK
ncbi:MAG: CPBP family intramembrane glutamic endopeptidase [Terriglobales bacterium]